MFLRRSSGKSIPYLLANRSWFGSAAAKNVAVILSGSGVYDGSECTEAVATLVHLSRSGAHAQCFAPNRDQLHALNHYTGQAHTVNRNVLEESARIARGNVKPLSELSVAAFDIVIFPGGFGAAKNFSSWAFDGAAGTLEDDVKNVITSFHGSGKPIGACCIAPTLIALALPSSLDIKITVGREEGGIGTDWPYASSAAHIMSLGHKHVSCGIDEVVVDRKNKLVTVPAYMYEGKPHEIFDSVGKMVDEVLQLP